MAWYRFRFRHGPGHQGDYETYRWYEGTLSDESQKDEMHEIAHERYIENWFCDCDEVKELPEKVRAEKVERYRGDKKHAEYMLKILGVKE